MKKKNEKEEERKEGNVSTTRKEMIEPRWKKKSLLLHFSRITYFLFSFFLISRTILYF